MRSFAGVLAHQLIKYAQESDTARALRTNTLIPRLRHNGLNASYASIRPQLETKRIRTDHCYEVLSSDDEDLSCSSSYKTAKVSKDVKQISTEYDILDEVYDCNGRVHQAVRIYPFYNEDGSKHYAKPRLCSHKRVGKICVATRTRVKCLQCDIALCFPLHMTMKNSRKPRNEYCFFTHIQEIPKVISPASSKYART